MFWRIKDWFINLFLDIRLWYFVNFKTEKLINVNNQIEKEGWELTFNDEFDKGDLDREKWRTDNYFGIRYHPGNITEKGIAPDVYFDDNCFEFTDTTMKQICINEPITINYVDWDGYDWGKYTIPYRVAMIDSSISFEQKYGYFEIRSKITDQPGHWPAFWLASTYAWPPEIDIYEIYTGKKNGLNNFESNFHWNPSYKKRMKVKGHKVLDVSKNFHVYAVEWDEKGFKIYYNNLLVRTFSNPKAINFFEHPMHIIINNSVDSREDRKLNESKFPTYHEVDYVRVYKKRGA
jgi:beta-glucanase (GH16 family)